MLEAGPHHVVGTLLLSGQSLGACPHSSHLALGVRLTGIVHPVSVIHSVVHGRHLVVHGGHLIVLLPRTVEPRTVRLEVSECCHSDGASQDCRYAEPQ
jgi:hypothetical protein